MSYEELDRVRVIERVIEKRLTQREAARVLGLTSRQVRRLRRAYERDGPEALASKHRGRPSNRRLPGGLRREALATVRSRYEDFGPTLAHEKLTELHGLQLSVETLRHWMIEDGLWEPRASLAPRIQQPRRRRPCRGELIQIDGCDHEWFEDRAPRCTLLVFVDDATSALMELRFCESESAFSYFAAMRAYLEQHGKPVALYSDKAGVFRVNQKEAQGGTGVTQFGRALSSLNIDIVCANTPEALRPCRAGSPDAAGSTAEEAPAARDPRCRGREDLRPGVHRRLQPPLRTGSAERARCHRPLQPSDDLARIFSWQETRLVSKSLTLNYKRVLYALDPTDAARAARGQRVGIEEREDGSLSFWHGEHRLLATAFPKEHGVQQGEVVDNKRLSEAMDFIKERQRERTEGKIAKPSTTLRKARLLRAGAHRWTDPGSSAEDRP